MLQHIKCHKSSACVAELLGVLRDVGRVYQLLPCDDVARLLSDKKIIGTLRDKHDVGVQMIAHLEPSQTE